MTKQNLIKQSHKIESWKFSSVSSPPDPQGGVKLYQYCSSVLPLGSGVMKQRKTSKIQLYAIALQNLIYCFFIYLFLVASYGCQQKATNEGLPVPAKMEAVKTAKKVIKKSSEVEQPAVIYKSTDMGLTWSSFAHGIPKEATLSGCLLYTSPSPRDATLSRMPSSA